MVKGKEYFLSTVTVFFSFIFYNFLKYFFSIWLTLEHILQIKEEIIASNLDVQSIISVYSKTSVKRPLSKRPQIGFPDQLSLNAGQNYCRMLQAEHSAVLLTFIKLPFAMEFFILSIFEWPFYTGFTVYSKKY